MTEIDQPFAVLVGEGTQQHAANDAEDRGVRPDAQAEREHDGNGEPAGAGEAAYGVAKVGDEHDGLLSVSCSGLRVWPHRYVEATSRKSTSTHSTNPARLVNPSGTSRGARAAPPRTPGSSR